MILLRFFIFLFLMLLVWYIVYGRTYSQHQFPQDFRGIIHLHSELSHDSNGKFKDIVKAAQKNEIDFVIMTDHWSPTLYEKSKRGFFDKTLFITGAEISKNEGVTIIALPLPKDFVSKNDWRKNVVSLREKGSLALASHIEFYKTIQLSGLDGVEIINLHAHILEQSKIGLVFTYFQAILPWNWNLAYIFDEIPNLPHWHYINEKVTYLPAFGGNDTHDNYRLFYKLGPKLGSYNNTFKLITTHIWADELSEESVKEAIKKGQGYLAIEVFGRATGFKFYAVSNRNVTLPGGEIELDDEEKIILTVQAPAHENPEQTKIKIFKDRKIAKKGSGALLNLETREPGNYYAEIWKNEKPWIFSNPIKITEK